jgi:hypothetical protein
LREQETAAVTEIGVVVAELVAVIAQRQRGFEAAGERLETPEMAQPVGIGQCVYPDLRGGAIVAETQDGRRKIGRSDGVIEFGAKCQNGPFGAKGRQDGAQAVG